MKKSIHPFAYPIMGNTKVMFFCSSRVCNYVMLNWVEYTCITSLGCLMKLGWVINVLAESQPLLSQMFVELGPETYRVFNFNS